MNTQSECRERWLALKAEFLAEVNKIDNDTPWSNSEPGWWLEMMTAAKAVREGGAA